MLSCASSLKNVCTCACLCHETGDKNGREEEGETANYCFRVEKQLLIREVVMSSGNLEITCCVIPHSQEYHLQSMNQSATCIFIIKPQIWSLPKTRKTRSPLPNPKTSRTKNVQKKKNFTEKYSQTISLLGRIDVNPNSLHKSVQTLLFEVGSCDSETLITHTTTRQLRRRSTASYQLGFKWNNVSRLSNPEAAIPSIGPIMWHHLLLITLIHTCALLKQRGKRKGGGGICQI